MYDLEPTFYLSLHSYATHAWFPTKDFDFFFFYFSKVLPILTLVRSTEKTKKMRRVAFFVAFPPPVPFQKIHFNDLEEEKK